MSAESTYLSRRAVVRSSRVTARFIPAVLLLFVFCSLPAIAQAAPSANSYAAAMAQAQPNTRILAMEDFLAHESSSPRKIDAFEVLVWDYKQVGNHQKAGEWAENLLDADAESPLALAVVAD